MARLVKAGTKQSQVQRNKKTEKKDPEKRLKNYCVFTLFINFHPQT